MLTLEQKQYDVALQKFEKLMGTFGRLPELLYYAAEAAHQAKRVPGSGAARTVRESEGRIDGPGFALAAGQAE